MTIRRGAALLLGLGLLLLAALIRPGPVVRWLARRYPDVLFQHETAEPLVALTIDDSPHRDLTPGILDVLAEHDARATFFLIGEQIPGNEAILQRMVDEGHELGNHLMTNAPSILFSGAEFERQLQQTHDLIAPYGPVRWFRPGSAWYSRRMLDQVQAQGYRCALGSAYAYDPQVRSRRYVTWHILSHIRPGAVIALHDGAGCAPQTEAVLRRVLPELERRGYRVVTLSELVSERQADRAGIANTGEGVSSRH